MSLSEGSASTPQRVGAVLDQAAGLRALLQPKPVKVIAVTSGKGGVGKTNIAVNLGVALAESGRSTLLLDGDLGLANVDVLLGLQPGANLAQVLAGAMELEDILLDGPAGLKVVPAASGVCELAELTAQGQGGIISAFSSLPLHVDVLLIDTATGIHQSVTGFCQAAHEVMVVVCDEPGSITDSYALIKVMSRERGVSRFRILCNHVTDGAHGERLFRALLRACDRFLDVSLSYCGAVPEDRALRQAVRRQQAVVECYPSSPSARALKELARLADTWAVCSPAGGQPAFFLERQLRCRQTMTAGVDD